jgi:hypothetical protein
LKARAVVCAAARSNQNPIGERQMKSNTIAIRRDAVARAPYLLLAVIDAAVKLGEAKAGFDEGDPELKTASDMFAENQHAAVESLATVCKEAESFRAMSERPQTINEALNAVAGSQKMFALAVDEYLTRLEAWRRADTQTGRIRVAVCERLQKDNGWSASAADKAASGDPEYTQHKDACADLADSKDVSEHEMKVAELGAKAALATLEAFTALQRGSGYPFLTTEQIASASGFKPAPTTEGKGASS